MAVMVVATRLARAARSAAVMGARGLVRASFRRDSAIVVVLQAAALSVCVCRDLFHGLTHASPGQHSVRQEGAAGTLECRYFFHDDLGRKMSPWHHIPLVSAAHDESLGHLHQPDSNIFQFVNEIPRGFVRSWRYACFVQAD